MTAFLAIDFETADNRADSACAVGLVLARNGRIARRVTRLIRPPRNSFYFTHIHGITWKDVRGQPSFGELWPELAPMMEGVDFLAAHNASFDRAVLRACCARAGLPAPETPFVCTVALARKTWGLRPANLPAVCRYLAIPLNHHDPASDALACAKIVLAAAEENQPRVSGL
jgi:DNA polymerase-3 subunit epsilon